MSNIKNQMTFFNIITGREDDGKYYGIDATVYKKVDNVEMIFDSRGKYLGIRICRGKFINGKYTVKKGIRDFKSSLDLEIWAGIQCPKVDFIETKEGNFMQIRQ